MPFLVMAGLQENVARLKLYKSKLMVKPEFCSSRFAGYLLTVIHFSGTLLVCLHETVKDAEEK